MVFILLIILFPVILGWIGLLFLAAFLGEIFGSIGHNVQDRAGWKLDHPGEKFNRVQYSDERYAARVKDWHDKNDPKPVETLDDVFKGSGFEAPQEAIQTPQDEPESPSSIFPKDWP